jgi:YidC/Oxa1 family membrane protein insertase
MWNTLILDPMINILIWLYQALGNNYVVSILIFTVLVRLLVFPLTWQQQKSMLAMQDLQPELKKLQEKYKDDQQTLVSKQQELYRQHGVNPLGGCLPTVIQFPILIGLYQAITQSLAASPIQLLMLSQHLYPSWNLASLIPLHSRFAWLNLAAPDQFFILPILVVGTTWLQQKLLTPPGAADPQQAAMTRSMQVTMPLFIGMMSLSFPSGLSVYWVLGNIIGIVQYAAMGRVSLVNQILGREERPQDKRTGAKGKAKSPVKKS